ncbi:MAG: TolC family protein [Ignavibacteriales bacterium]|nr:MAG: TolC family protein [Ignavibacteriales bacterium]
MRYFLSILLIVGLSINLSAQKKLTLDDAIKIGLQKNTVLQKGINSLEGNESSVKSAYGGLLPSFSAGGSFNWSRSEEKGNTSIFFGIPITTPAQTSESRSYSVNASANWTLFDGLANFASISQSKNNLEAARLSLQRLKQDIIFEIITRFYAVLNAKEVLKVREDDLAWNKKNLEVITERNRLGSVTLADVYAAQVKVGNSELALIQAGNDVATLQSEFLNSLGLDVFQELDLVDPISGDKAELQAGKNLIEQYKDLQQNVNETLNNRFDYQSALLSLKSADNSVTMAQSGYFPRLSNSYSFYSRANKLSEIGDSRSYNIGLSLDIPIFDGWSTENQVQSAKVNFKNKEVELTELERTIKINLKQTYLDFQTAEKRLSVSENNVLSAEQNRKIEQEKYNLGSSTLVNLLLASSEYTSALQTNINNRFEFFRLKSQLEYYLGILDYKKFE